MKKIIIFNPIITAGGISKIVSDYIENFNSVDADLLTFEVKNNIYFNSNKNNIYTIGKSKNIIQRMKKEYKILKEGHYDIIHINGDFSNRLIECICAKIAGIPRIIVHSHSTGASNISNIKKIFHIFIKNMFNFVATDYFACSVDAAKWMFPYRVIKRKKYQIIKNGIDINKFKYSENSRNEIRSELNLNNKYVIGFVGRFSFEKNPLFVLDIFNECKKIDSRCALMLIGTGILEKEIKEKVNELNLNNDVVFLGNVNDVYRYYNAMDCFVLPSFYEGLGIVNIEAQCSGVKVVCSDRVPIEAKVTENISFVSLNDKKKWVNDILSKKKIKREESYKSVLKNGYDIRAVSRELEKEYNR